jgi:hypothetical protein
MMEITIHAVMGDTLLSSVAWFHGSKYTPMDLYDCCIVFLEIFHSPEGMPRLLAVPAVRVLGLRIARDPPPSDIGDVESKTHVPEEEMRFSSSGKGAPNLGPDSVDWYFLIPCQGDRWIQLGLNPTKVLKTTSAKIVTGQEVTAKLQSKDWNVNLENVEMVNDVLSMSRSVTDMVVELFGTKLGVVVTKLAV